GWEPGIRTGLFHRIQDRQALGQDVAVAEIQRRGEALRIDRAVLGLALLAGDQVDADVIVGDALELQADAHPVGRRRAPRGIEGQAHQTTLNESWPTLSTSPVTASPRTRGP